MKRILSVLALLPGPAFAHSGHVGDQVFWAGMTHPLGGADHVLAMVAVGLWAAMLGGRALWALPMAFVAAMIVGGMAGAFNVPLPGVEPGILASILVLGAVVSLAVKASPAQAAAVVALFGLLHGHAHGAEGPAQGMALYAAGFVLATLALHALGLLTGRLVHGFALRALGGVTLAGGLALAIGG